MRARSPLRFALLYIAASCLWIVVSDKVLGYLSLGPQVTTVASIFKGCVYVAVSAWLIFAILDRLERANHNLESKVLNRTAALQLSEEISRAREEWLTRLLASLPDVSWTVAEDGRPIFISSNIKAIYGFSAKELCEDPETLWLARIHPRDQQRVIDSFSALFSQGEPFDVEYQIQRKDGRWIWVQDRAVHTHTDAGVLYADGVFSDITARKAAETAREKSERRYRNLFENSGAGVFRAEVGGSFLECNPALVEMLGYDSASELQGRPTSAVLNDPSLESDLVERLRSEGSFKNFEICLKRKDGSPLWGLHNVSLLKSENGVPLTIEGTVVDITDRRKSEEALGQQLATTQAIASTAPVALVMMDPEGHITFANPAAEGISGYFGGELLGRSAHEVCHYRHPDGSSFPRSECPIHQCLRSGESLIEHEDTFFRKDGTAISVMCGAAPVLVNGQIVGSVMIVQDISARKRAEESLRESELQFRSLANAIPQLCWMADSSGNTFWYNDRWYSYTGTTAKQMEGAGWKSVHDPAVLPEVVKRWADSVATGQSFDMVFPLRGADGAFRTFLTRVTPVRDKGGKVIRWFGTNTDISEQKQIEDDLRKSNERLDQVLEVANIGEWSMDLVNHTAERSLRHARIFGYDSLLPGWTFEAFLEHVLPEHRAEVREKISTALTNGYWDLETQIRRSDGAIRWIWVRGRAQNNEAGIPARMSGTVLDITERKQTEDRVREQAAMMDLSPEPIMVCDAEGVVLSWNRGAEELYGYSKAEAIGQVAIELLKVNLPLPRREIIDQMRQTGRWEGELSQTGKDGRQVTVTSRWGLFQPAGHYQSLRVMGINIDITERKRIEQELRQRQHAVEKQAVTLKTLVERAPTGLLVVDREMRALIISDRLCQVYSLDRQAVLGKSLYEIFPDYPERWKEVHRRCLAGAVMNSERDSWVASDGKEHWLRWETRPYGASPSEVEGLIIFSEDMTEMLALERQFLHAQKMEAIGRLAGGVAHDFNNLLQVINGYASLITEETESSSIIGTGSRAIQEAGRRAADLTRQLLSFSRREVSMASTTLFDHAVMDLESMARTLVGSQIDLGLHLDAGGARIGIDAGQLEQIVMNLLVNARDAMPDGGRLTIATRRTSLDAAACRSLGVVIAGSYVKLTISDTGCGMAAHIRNRVFEPFFTTKERGRGTGLGLSTVYGLVTHSGGGIEVESEVGVGTTFHIYLPVVDSDVTIPEDPTPLVAPSGKENILLVEDDEHVRDLIGHQLRSLGYQVTEAANGYEALRLLGQSAVPTDLVISDMVMPKMAGTELSGRISEILPDLKILEMTGYTDAPLRESDVANLAFRLQKPFTLETLATTVREMLDRDNPTLVDAPELTPVDVQ